MSDYRAPQFFEFVGDKAAEKAMGSPVIGAREVAIPTGKLLTRFLMQSLEHCSGCMTKWRYLVSGVL